MAIEFTDNGIVVESLDQIRTRVTARFQQAYGDDIPLGADSWYGQAINIMSEIILDSQTDTLNTSTQFDIDAAISTQLSTLVKLNGITRIEEQFSTTTVEVTANNAGTNILEGDRIKDPNQDVEWRIASDVTVAPNATESVVVIATVSGPIPAGPNTLTEIVTTRFGWASVTNPNAAIQGIDREADPTLRRRQRRVATAGGSYTAEFIRSQILELDGVRDAIVIENITGADLNGQPDGTLRPIVLGGTDLEVATVVHNNRGGGIRTFGTTPVQVPDDASPTGFAINNITRPTERRILVAITTTTGADFPLTGVAQIKQAVVDWFNGDLTINGRPVPAKLIGDDIERNRLFTAVNAIPGHNPSEILIAMDGDTPAAQDIPVGVDEIAVTDLAAVTVNGS